EGAPEIPDPTGRKGPPNIVLNDRLYDRKYGRHSGTVKVDGIAGGGVQLGGGEVIENHLSQCRARKLGAGVGNEVPELGALVRVDPDQVEGGLRYPGRPVEDRDRTHYLRGHAGDRGVSRRRRRDVRVDRVGEGSPGPRWRLVADDLVVVADGEDRVVDLQLVDRVPHHEAPGDDRRRDEKAEYEEDRPPARSIDVPDPDAKRQAVAECEDQSHQGDPEQNQKESAGDRVEGGHGI